MSVSVHTRPQLVSNHWRVICSFMPVGGPDGQWRIAQVCKGLMPADVDRARCAWNESYNRFVAGLRLGDGDTLLPPLHADATNLIQWTASQQITLRLMAEAVRRLFRPRTEMAQHASKSMVIRYNNARRTGLSSALVHFQRVLLEHCRRSLRLRRYCTGADTVSQIPTSSQVSRRRATSEDPMPSPTPYPHVIVCDELWAVNSDKSVLLRPGGVCIVVSRSLWNPHMSDQEQMASKLVTPYQYIELKVHGDLGRHHVVNAVDKTNPDAPKLLATQHTSPRYSH